MLKTVFESLGIGALVVIGAACIQKKHNFVIEELEPYKTLLQYPKLVECLLDVRCVVKACSQPFDSLVFEYLNLLLEMEKNPNSSCNYKAELYRYRIQNYCHKIQSIPFRNYHMEDCVIKNLEEILKFTDDTCYNISLDVCSAC